MLCNNLLASFMTRRFFFRANTFIFWVNLIIMNVSVKSMVYDVNFKHE